MGNYEYGRIRVLAESLAAAGVAEEVAAQILAGGDQIAKTAKPAAKAAWFGEAMERMDALLEADTRHAVRERCACCLGGKRLQLSRAIARDYESLEGRLRAANETHLVFGHSVTRVAEDEVLVSFFPEGQKSYRCVCLSKAREPISITYCYCCGGHVKHHLQHALGRKLQMTVRSSALASGGREPCTFLLRIVDDEKETPAV